MARSTPASAESNEEHLTFKQFRLHLGSMIALLTAGGVITWVLLTDGVRDVAFRLSGELQPLYYKQVGGLDVQQIGWLGSIFGAATMLANLLSGWVADRYGDRVSIVGGFLLQFAAILVFLSAGNFWIFAAAALLFGLGVGMMSPAYNALVSKVVPERMRGIAYGLFQSSIGIISLPAPWLGAQLWTRFSPRLPFGLTAGALLVTTIPAWLKFHLPKTTPPPEENLGYGS